MHYDESKCQYSQSWNVIQMMSFQVMAGMVGKVKRRMGFYNAMIRRTNYTFLLLNADIRWWCNKRMFGLLYKIHLIFSHLLSHILHLVWLGFNKNPFFAFVILYVFKWNEVIDYIYYPHSKNECIIIF